MAHLTCKTHKRRVQVTRTPVENWTDEIKVIHRNDGSRCPTTSVQIGGASHLIASDHFHAGPSKRSVK